MAKVKIKWYGKKCNRNVTFTSHFTLIFAIWYV